MEYYTLSHRTNAVFKKTNHVTKQLFDGHALFTGGDALFTIHRQIGWSGK